MFWRSSKRHAEQMRKMSQEELIEYCVGKADAMLRGKCEDQEKLITELYRALEIEQAKVKALQACIRGDGK